MNPQILSVTVKSLVARATWQPGFWIRPPQVTATVPYIRPPQVTATASYIRPPQVTATVPYIRTPQVTATVSYIRPPQVTATVPYVLTTRREHTFCSHLDNKLTHSSLGHKLRRINCIFLLLSSVSFLVT